VIGGAEWTDVNRASQQLPTRLGKGTMHYCIHRDRGPLNPHEHASLRAPGGCKTGVGPEWRTAKMVERRERERGSHTNRALVETKN